MSKHQNCTCPVCMPHLWAAGIKGSKATEGALETDSYPGVAARFKEEFGIDHPRQMRKSELKRPEPSEGFSGDALCYEADAATVYMDALESRNAELERLLKEEQDGGYKMSAELEWYRQEREPSLKQEVERLRQLEAVAAPLIKRMFDEVGTEKAEAFITRVRSGEYDVPSPWADKSLEDAPEALVSDTVVYEIAEGDRGDDTIQKMAIELQQYRQQAGRGEWL